jgi:hypothetical protein
VVENFSAIAALLEIGTDIGLRGRGIVAGITKVFGIVRVAAVAGQIGLLDPQARVIAARLVVVGPAVRPVAVDAESPFLDAVRGKTRAVLPAGPKRAGSAIEVAAASRIAERMAAQAKAYGSSGKYRRYPG